MSKLTKNGMFNTPKNWKEIEDWINLHSPEDRIYLLTAAMMAWNLAAELTKEIENVDKK